MYALSLVAFFICDNTTIFETKMSGDVSQFACGIVNAHYTWHNMSSQSKSSVHVTITFLGTFGEALIYASVGMSLYTRLPGWWSFPLIGYVFMLLCGTRVAFIYVLSIVQYIPCKYCKTIGKIPFNEMNYLAAVGMVKGAISFALVSKMKKCDSYTEGLILKDFETYATVDCF